MENFSQKKFLKIEINFFEFFVGTILFLDLHLLHIVGVRIEFLMTKKRPQSVETPKNGKCSYFKPVTESIVPTFEPGVLRDDQSNCEGLVPELESRNSKISDGSTLNS